MLERDVEAYLVAAVKARGGKAWKWVSPGYSGVADRIVALPGKDGQPGVVWMIEVKTDTGKLSPLQAQFRREAQALGANYVCLYGRKDVDLWLRSV